MKISRTASFGIGAVFALVLGGGTAYAATGGTFVLGKSNTASTPTSLTNSSGIALSLNSKTGSAPLKVNHTTKVTNLNSDQLDGLDSTKFALTTGQTNTIQAVSTAIDTDNDGIEDTLMAFATCPSGTRLTGGGADDYTADGVLYVNAPVDKTAWAAVSTADVSTADPADVDAYAICYNPRGSVSGGAFRTTTSAQPTTSQLDAMKAKLAKKHR